MMNERKALYRQLQHWFETQLFGLYRWSEVEHREAERVVVDRDWRGRRINQRSLGRWVEKVVIVFDGYTLEMRSSNECEPDSPGEAPKPAILLYDGKPQPENIVVQGANCSETWTEMTRLLRANMEGKSNGRQEARAGS